MYKLYTSRDLAHWSVARIQYVSRNLHHIRDTSKYKGFSHHCLTFPELALTIHAAR